VVCLFTIQSPKRGGKCSEFLLKRWELRKGRASSEIHYACNRSNRRMNKPPPVIDKRMPEPMEVDHFRSQQRCYSCGKLCHLARQCRGQERVGSP
jgi:hypothetical protein